MWGLSSPSGSRALSLGAKALSSYRARQYHRLLFLLMFRLYSFTSYRHLSGDWGLFQILFLLSHCLGSITLDLITIPFSAYTVGWSDKYFLTPLSDYTADWGFLVIYPIVNSLRKLGHCKRSWILFRIICLYRHHINGLLMSLILWPLAFGNETLKLVWRVVSQ